MIGKKSVCRCGTLLMAGLMVLSMAACGDSGAYSEAECVKITLHDNSAACDAKDVKVEEGLVTITGEGSYLLSGDLADGMIVVAAEDTAKVQLVLDGVTIANKDNAAIYVQSADKVFITLAAGSSNQLSNGGSYTVLDDNNIDGVIFSKSDVVINGDGGLNVTAKNGHGIVSKDDLKIAGGTLDIQVPGHGLSGKDSVRIVSGNVNVNAGKDGIHSNNEEDADKGYVYIGDGILNLTTAGDGVDAVNFVQVDGGTLNITAGGGNTNRTVTQGEDGDTVSTKGIKAGTDLVLNEGSFVLDTQDDSLHSNGSLTVNGGVYKIASGDDALHSDETTTVAGGNMDITACYEGIEGKDVVISGGYIKMTASDDGINAAGGNDQSGFGGFFGGDRFGEATDSSVKISGGTIYINADGDGLDSNGELIVTGGEVYISGPENGGNGALDYTGTGQITGGTVVAVGSMQMAMNFDNTSTQGSILITTDNMSAGEVVSVKDASGKEIIHYVTESAFNSVLVSSPLLVQGGTYTISVGGNETEVTLEELIYGSGFGMGGFGGFGGMGGFGGGKGDHGQRPDGERPQMPEGGMPETGEWPQMPEGGTPGMGEWPQMPEGGMPGGERPQMPEGGMPGGSEVPKSSSGAAEGDRGGRI